VFEQATYWLTLAGVSFLVGVLFLYSGKSKLFDDDGHAPAPLVNWVMIGILEFAIFLLIVLSIARGEFFPHRAKPNLLAALSLALLTFACLSSGQTSTGNNAGTASLYTYFASTAIIYILVARLPPNRP
jgi:uncharacterized membrane protein